MKKLIGLLSLSIAITSCNAQYRIQKAQAFFTVSIPGMQRVDENGNKINPPPTIERFIYIVCSFNNKPKVDTVFYNRMLFSASLADNEDKVFIIGINKNSGKPVKLIPKKGGHLWKIYLRQTTAESLSHEAVNKIIIKGSLGKTKFSYMLTSETELTTPDSY